MRRPSIHCPFSKRCVFCVCLCVLDLHTRTFIEHTAGVYTGWSRAWFISSSIFTLTNNTHTHTYTHTNTHQASHRTSNFSISTTVSRRCVSVGSFMLSLLLFCDEKVGEVDMWGCWKHQVMSSKYFTFLWWGQRHWYHSLDTTTILNCVWQRLFVCVYSLSFFFFCNLWFYFTTWLCFQDFVLYFVIREWTTPFDTFMK